MWPGTRVRVWGGGSSPLWAGACMAPSNSRACHAAQPSQPATQGRSTSWRSTGPQVNRPTTRAPRRLSRVGGGGGIKLKVWRPPVVRALGVFFTGSCCRVEAAWWELVPVLVSLTPGPPRPGFIWSAYRSSSTVHDPDSWTTVIWF